MTDLPHARVVCALQSYTRYTVDGSTFLFMLRLLVRMGRRSRIEGLCMQRPKNASLESISSSVSCWERLEEGHVTSNKEKGGGAVTKPLEGGRFHL